MTDLQTDEIERVELTTVQIRRSTHARMKRYRITQMPRPSLTDLATVAIEQYLDARDSGTEGGA